MDDLISRQAAISAICNACGKIDCDKMDKCEKLQLPPANYSEFPNNSDTISRQAAIDALNEQIEQCNKALGSFDISLKDEFAIKVERASLEAYKEQLENLPPVQPNHNAEVSKMEIIHCKDCKHWNLQVGNVKGDGLGSCDFHNVNFVTGEGFCYWAEKRGDTDGRF